MNDKMQGGEIRTDNRFTRWLDNYWYHYKWHTIFGIFALVVILICTLQMCQKESYDISIVYAGPHPFTQGAGELASAVAGVMPEDFNGDGRRSVEVVNLLIYTEEQIDALIEAARAEGNDNPMMNTALIAQEKSKFNQLVLAGEHSIFLIDPALFEHVQASGGWLTLAEALGEKPDYAVNDWAVRLCDTEFGRYFPAVAELPEETLLCIRREGTLNTLLNHDRAEQTYRRSLETFRAMLRME